MGSCLSRLLLLEARTSNFLRIVDHADGEYRIEDRMTISGDADIIQRFKDERAKDVDKWQCHAAAEVLFSYFKDKRKAWLRGCRWVPPCGSQVKRQKRIRAPNTTTNRAKRQNIRSNSEKLQITSILTACDNPFPSYATLPNHPLHTIPNEFIQDGGPQFIHEGEPQFIQDGEPQFIPTTSTLPVADPPGMVVWSEGVRFHGKKASGGPGFTSKHKTSGDIATSSIRYI